MKAIRQNVISIKNQLAAQYPYVEEEILFSSLFACLLEVLGLEQNKEFENHLLDRKTKDSIQLLAGNMKKNKLSIESLLGWFYQYFYEGSMQQEQLGQYYTQDWIVKYIVDQTFEKYFCQNQDKPLRLLKVFEPCCGSGNFIFYILDKLVELYFKKEGLKPQDSLPIILRDNLYAMDIDQRALKILDIALSYKLKRLHIEAKLENTNIEQGNYLEKKIFHNFDIIVGNPPYLENRKINKYLNKDVLKEKFKTARGRFDLLSIFLEKSIDDIYEKGIIGYILPASILVNNNFVHIRQKILKECAITQVINMGDGVFSHVYMDMSIILLLKNCHESRKQNIIETKNLKVVGDKKNRLVDSNFVELKQAYYYNTLKNVFDVHSTPAVFCLRDRVYEDYPPLKEHCEIIAGVATGNIRHKLLSRKQWDLKQVPVLEGKDIQRYFCQWNGLYLFNDRRMVEGKKGEYATFMREEFVLQPKLLIRQTADCYIAAYDEEQYYLLNTLYACISKNEKLHIKYVLALLNSKLLNFMYQSLIYESKKLFPQIKIYHIQNSPIKIEKIGTQQYFIRIVDYIEYLKKEYFYSAGNDKSIELEIKKQQYKIDQAIFDIFELSKKEISMIENKNIEN